MNNTAASRPRVLVVAPFTHQNGHFVTFPRDVACGLAAAGCEVTLVHGRPFRGELDWFGQAVRRVCLQDGLANAPRLWRGVWARLMDYPAVQCLSWLIWRVRRGDYDLVLWSDVQEPFNLWLLAIVRRLGLYRTDTAFFEHFAPPSSRDAGSRLVRTVRRWPLSGLSMIVMSRDLDRRWRQQLGHAARIEYLAHGLWPAPQGPEARARARATLVIAPTVHVLLVFGMQATERKHLDTLRRALTGFAVSRPLLLLFTGRTVGGAAHAFEGWTAPGIEVRIDNRFVSDTQAAAHFTAADTVWSHYRDFPGASGVLLQAMGFGRIAIASSGGEIGALCRQHDLGQVVADDTEAAIRHALKALIELPPAKQLAWERKIAIVAEAYAWHRLMRSLVSRLGLQSAGAA